MTSTTPDLKVMRNYFSSGATLPYAFRKSQLLALKSAIKKYEKEIGESLNADLKKSPEEAYFSETGLVLKEISFVLKNLEQWMSSQKVATDLLNFPSHSRVYPSPLGVVLIIAPWNYPFQLALLPLVGAIAAGNCVVIKPSEVAVQTSSLLEKIITEIFHPDYIRCIPGDGAQVVPDLMQHFRFDHVFYTGSTYVGKLIYQMAADKLVPVTLELGGKSPCVVERSCDLNIAAKRIALGKFSNAGQTCIAPDYILVDEAIKENLIELLIINLKKFYPSGNRNNYDYGKIINTKRFEKLVSFLQNGNIRYGGEYNAAELYIQPTIIDNITAKHPVMQEEIFGPVLPIITYGSIQEAIEFINQFDKPLAFYLFTNDRSSVQHWINSVSFGGGCINNTVWHFTNPNLPFGGIGHSGTGAYHGKYSFKTFTHYKPLMNTPTWFDPAIKYPPMKGKLKWVKRLMR